MSALRRLLAGALLLCGAPALAADGDWKSGDVEPYAWGQYSADNDLSQFGLGGGAGRVHDTGQTGRSFLLETGAEKAAGSGAAGAEYRLIVGTIGGPEEAIRYGDALRGRSAAQRARGTAPALPSYGYSEFAGYGRVPVDRATLGLRVSLGLPSYARSIWTEEFSAKIPVAVSWRVRTAVAFEQSATRSAYVTLGGEYLF